MHAGVSLNRAHEIARLISRIDHECDNPRSCWLWRDGLDEDGYARICVDDTMHQAHRFAYKLLIGPIPDDLTVDHLCRNKACVNPDHLEPVTLLENIRRAAAIRTHCPNGHEYTKLNTRIRAGTINARVCRTCDRRRARAYVKRKQEISA